MRIACVALTTLIGCAGSGDDGPPFSSGAGPYFATPMFWNQDVSGVAKASYSDATIGAPATSGR